MAVEAELLPTRREGRPARMKDGRGGGWDEHAERGPLDTRSRVGPCVLTDVALAGSPGTSRSPTPDKNTGTGFRGRSHPTFCLPPFLGEKQSSTLCKHLGAMTTPPLPLSTCN